MLWHRSSSTGRSLPECTEANCHSRGNGALHLTVRFVPLISFLLFVTERLGHRFTGRPASETAVALWVWRSFARMVFLDTLARRAEKAGRASRLTNNKYK